MTKLLTMPRLGETMEQGTVRSWLIKPGIAFKRGDVIAEIETDKTVVEFPALEDGIVERFLADDGDVVSVGAPLAELVDANPSLSRKPDGHGESAGQPVGDAARNAASPTVQPHARPPIPSRTHEKGRVLASPAARKLARKHSIDLARVSATGRQGRVQGWDIRAALSSTGVGNTNLPLHYSVRGTGEKTPVLMLHGFGGDSESWLGLSVPLAQNRVVIALDLPGHGRSVLHQATGFEAMAEAVAATLDQLGHQHVHVVGHSMGGGVGLALALAKPQSVASLTLFAPAGLGTKINARLLLAYASATEEREIALILDQFFGASAKIPRGLAASITATRTDAHVQEALRRTALAMLDGHDQRSLPMEKIAALTMPIRVIWGDEDRILPMTQTRKLPGMIAVHRYSGIGHMPHIEIGRDALRLVQMTIASE
jgi:pimeloyl-ACP methyl ester carboxylesterase